MAFVSLTPVNAVGSRRCSALCGNAVCPTERGETHAQPAARRNGVIEMKKARFHQPLRPQRPDAMKIPEDGTPIFSVFVRSPRSNIWFPLGAVAGDDRSKTLVNALKGNFGKALYQNSLDKGIAQTIYGKEGSRFLQTALRQYPQLKKNEKILEFGYKVSAKDLDEMPTRVVDKDMALPFFQWVKARVDKALDASASA